MIYKLICLLLGVLLLGQALAQSGRKVTFEGWVKDKQTDTPLEAATLQLYSVQDEFLGTVTGKEGRFKLELLPGIYKLILSFIGYETVSKELEITCDDTVVYRMLPSSEELSEVVVTATEVKGATSESRIDAEAMRHRQPASFADLLSLLPGGVSTVPALGNASLVRLRQAGDGGSGFDISSLGTAFVVDGHRLPTDANMQAVAQIPSSSSDSYSHLEFANRGVDMRAISTDQIGSVEIVRGVASAEYGDLTSGLIRINRKKGYTPWTARFKADPYGKLFAIGKGIEWKEQQTSLNFGLDYIDARPDPRDEFSTYKRLTGSFRVNKLWKGKNADVHWALTADYTGSFDDRKKDPEITLQKEDSYKASYNAMSLGNTFLWDAMPYKTLTSLELTTYISLQQDQIRQTKFVALDRDRVVPNSMEAGESDAVFLPYKYTARLLVDGKPFHAAAKWKAGLDFSAGMMANKAIVGVEWNMDKNYGRGQVYDINRPLNPGTALRPTSFRDIPAGHKMAFFMEDRADIPWGNHYFKLSAGLRGSMLLHLDEDYLLSNKIYWDPRLSVQWRLPVIGNGWRINLSGSIGWQTKMPTLQQLHPYNLYKDIIQLNYFDLNPDHRRLNILTYVIDPANYRLQPARNRKGEVKMDISYKNNDLSLTCFRETMNSGFRSSSEVSPYVYKKYDASGIEGNSLQGPPDLAGIPWKADTILDSYSKTTNGSALWKEGVEFQFTSARVDVLATKLTMNGAWFRTTYKNSQAMFDPSVTTEVVNAIPVNTKYVGYYNWTEGYEKQQFNTTFILDTYLKQLGLTFSTWVECIWFESSRRLRQNGTPLAYMDVTGKVHPFTEEDAGDTYKQWLVQRYNEDVFRKKTIPFCMYVNLKATKDFGKYIRLALFVDRLLDYAPDYKSNGYTIRRNVNPYFGMELNIRL